MFTYKPKKVFEKLNKMDRKQAYTIGAIVAVSVVALLMVFSMASTEDESFQGFDSRGYDLADVKFTDAAEQYLLASKYPDMQENGSTLLYSKEQKEARQEADAQAVAEEENEEEHAVSEGENAADLMSGSTRGYGGYAGGSGSGKRTEVGQLSSAGMATAGGSGGSGFNVTYGPQGDFHQFKGREDRGLGSQTPLVIDRQKEAAAFRKASMQAARAKDNKLTAARKAVQQLSVDGTNPTTSGPTIDDVSKGFSIGDGDLPSTTDLDNLDKKVEDAAKKAEEDDKKDDEEEKLGFWAQLGQDLIRQAATTLVDSVMGGIGDSIKGAMSDRRTFNSARRGASDQIYNDVNKSKNWKEFSKNNPYGLTQDQYNTYKNSKSAGQAYRKVGKGLGYTNAQGSAARAANTGTTTQIGGGKGEKAK